MEDWTQEPRYDFNRAVVKGAAKIASTWMGRRFKDLESAVGFSLKQDEILENKQQEGRIVSITIKDKDGKTRTIKLYDCQKCKAYTTDPYMTEEKEHFCRVCENGCGYLEIDR